MHHNHLLDKFEHCYISESKEWELTFPGAGIQIWVGYGIVSSMGSQSPAKVKSSFIITVLLG